MQQKASKPFVKGFKFPIYPTEEQCILLEKTFGCCRFVYNKGLAEAKRDYESYLERKESLIGLKAPGSSGYDLVKKLPLYKKNPDLQWLKEISAVALQQSMLHLGMAFTRFFREKKGYPKFKKKQHRQSFTLVGNSFSLKNKVFTITNSKEQIKIVFTRELPSQPSQATISRTPSGKYYVSFLCEYIPPILHGKGKIGVDLGLKDFLVTSDGVRITNPKYLSKYTKQLRRAQQLLSRRKKGSANRNKARLKVAKLHERVANCRKDFHHKLSRILVNENQVIGVEKLMVKNMVRNRRLSNAISDVSWSSFTSMLDYKSRESQNCSVVYMDTFFPSSHLCHKDKYRLTEKLQLNQRSWICPECGAEHDRDINAAINIRDEAIYAIEAAKLQNHAGLKILARNRY